MWYPISNIDQIDSPALVIYPERVRENIRILKTFVPETNRLRPHVKTHKSPEVARLMLEEDIHKFKCATIAEAEMLAVAGADDILLAYQPTGPKAVRLAELMEKFPQILFSCLVDNEGTAREISKIMDSKNICISVFLDLNVGMNRTGIKPEKAFDLFQMCIHLAGVNPVGLHAYDGHLRDANLEIRTQRCDEGFAPVVQLKNKIQEELKVTSAIVAGGTPTFPIHAKRKEVECSPGTFIFWDTGYGDTLKEQPFLFAALVITRVISKPGDNTLCLDLGHKSIASENPLPHRVTFLNAPELEAIGHSEEHLVVKTDQPERYKVGDVLYGVPFHICPTVALHDFAWTVVNGKADIRWAIEARKRKIEV